MPTILSVDDLTPFAEINQAKAMAMVEDAVALAARVAPCILSDSFAETAAARAILRGAVLRWHEAGTGAFQQRQIGPFGESYDTRQTRRGMFWPTEIEALQELCRGDSEPAGAFSVDTVSTTRANHAEICALNFGAVYCSCGAVLTNELYPIFEV